MATLRAAIHVLRHGRRRDNQRFRVGEGSDFADVNMADTPERRVFVDLYKLIASRVPSSTVTVF